MTRDGASCRFSASLPQPVLGAADVKIRAPGGGAASWGRPGAFPRRPPCCLCSLAQPRASDLRPPTSDVRRPASGVRAAPAGGRAHIGARAGLGNRAGGPGLRPLWPCRVRPGLRGGAGRRGHRRVTGVSPGVLRAGLPVPLRRRRKRYFPRHVAGRPVPAGRPVAGTLRHSGSCSRPWGRPGGARPPADPGSRAEPVSFHGPSDPVASRSGPAGAFCAQSATQRPQSWEEPGGLVRGGGNRPPVAASGQHPAATALPTSVPVCTSESPWEAESVLLGDQPEHRPPYRLSSQRLPGPLFCLSHLLLC